MALGEPHIITEDDPSEVVRLTRKELNKLMDAVESLATEIEGAMDFAAAQTAITATVQPLVADVSKVLVYFERAAAPE